ncbi:hypothetical protein [Spirillospora sp. NPDC047279]|uniref:hypothetical protein n=1 Tax=Spirillospora sp. NPDC047279 TaxID=3155478 RepID=UPI0033E2AB6B
MDDHENEHDNDPAQGRRDRRPEVLVALGAILLAVAIVLLVAIVSPGDLQAVIGWVTVVLALITAITREH